MANKNKGVSRVRRAVREGKRTGDFNPVAKAMRRYTRPKKIDHAKLEELDRPVTTKELLDEAYQQASVLMEEEGAWEEEYNDYDWEWDSDFSNVEIPEFSEGGGKEVLEQEGPDRGGNTSGELGSFEGVQFLEEPPNTSEVESSGGET